MNKDRSRSEFADDCRNADQMEASALISGFTSYDAGLTDDVISGRIKDDDDATGTSIDETIRADARIESDTSNAIEVIKSRQLSLGDKYPFRICKSGSLEYVGSATCVYEFCLVTSLQTDLKSKPYCELPVAFERLVAHVVAAWLGRNALWFRMGWPPGGDRPATFRAAVEQLHSKCGEFYWNPLNQFYDSRASDGILDVKDAGLDIVVWRVPDNRPGGVFLVGQCACGDNWDQKFKDLDLETLSKTYVRITQDLIRFFATPFDLGHQATWLESSIKAGILFDRVRITDLAESSEHRERILKDAGKPYCDLVKLVANKALVKPRPFASRRRNRDRKSTKKTD